MIDDDGLIDKHTLDTGDVVEYKDVNIKIEKRRWEAFIEISDETGNVLVEYVASADAFYTEHDRLWLGTLQEFEEWSDTLGPQYWANRARECGEKR